MLRLLFRAAFSRCRCTVFVVPALLGVVFMGRERWGSNGWVKLFAVYRGDGGLVWVKMSFLSWGGGTL